MRDGWSDFKFKDVAKAFKGKLPKDKNELGIGLPYLTANYLRSNAPDFWIENLEGAVIAEQDECLILWDGAGAGDLFKAQNGVVSSTMAVVKSVNAKILRDFLTLFISSKANYIKETCRGTTVPHVSPDAIENMNLIIPPLAEQKRIVDLISSVDSYIEALQQQVDKAKKSRNAVLHELLTKGGDGWVETTLGEVTTIINGGTPSTKNADYWGGEIVWITTTELTASDGKRVNSSKRTITQDGLNSGPARMVRAGTTLVGTTATIGTCAIAACDLTFNQQISGLLPKTNKIDDGFLFYWIQFAKPIFEGLAAGTSFKRISTSVLKTVEIKFPPLPEQKRIVEIISVFDNQIEALDSTIAKSKNLRSALLSDLLSGNHEIPSTYDKLIGAA
jgi:type I restriction enzyme S subunit